MARPGCRGPLRRALRRADHAVRASGRPETRAETAALVDEYIAEYAAAGFTKWRVADLDDHLVGRAGFGPHRDGRELGYTIRRDQWGQGLASEIGAALVTWHVTHAADISLYAYVAADNLASRRVVQKIGFESIGREDYRGVLGRVPRAV